MRKICRRTRPARPGRTGVLQHIFCGPKEGRRAETDSQPQGLQPLHAGPEIQDGNNALHHSHYAARSVASLGGLKGRLFSCSDSGGTSKISPLPHQWKVLPIPSDPVRAIPGPQAVHQNSSGPHKVVETERYSLTRLLGRYPDPRRLPAGSSGCPDDHYQCADPSRVHHQCQKIRSAPDARPCIHRRQISNGPRANILTGRQAKVPHPSSKCVQASRSAAFSTPVAADLRPDGSNYLIGRPSKLKHAAHPVVPQEPMAASRRQPRSKSDGTKVTFALPQLVVRPQELVSGQALPGSALHTDSHHRCIHGRLGGTLLHQRRGTLVLRPVVTRRVPVSHQLPRTQSYPTHTEQTGDACGKPPCSHRMRQHVCSGMDQPPGRDPLLGLVAGDTESVPVDVATQCDTGSSPPPRGGQCLSGLPVKEPSRPHRVESVESGLQQAFPPLGKTADRPVCISRESQTSPVVQSEPVPGSHGSRRILPDMDGVEGVCLPSLQSDSENTPENQRRGSRGSTGSGSPLAQPAMVHPSPSDGEDSTTPLRAGDNAADTETPRERHAVSPRPRDSKIGSLETERQAWQQAGFSEAVINTAMAAKRASTRSVYDSRWRCFVSWCQRRDLDPVTAPVTRILDYLQSLSEKLAVNTIKGHLTAISSRHERVRIGRKRRTRVARASSVRTWMRGQELSNPAPRILVPSWNLEVVLSALKKPPYYPLNQCSLKHLTWRTVFLVALTSARRASEIHAINEDSLVWGSTSVTAFVNIDFLPKVATQWHCNQPMELPAMHRDADQELRKLCVRSSLNAYWRATKVHRAGTGASQLFLCYGKKALGQPVSKQRISQWLKEVIQDCYTRRGLPPPKGVKGHQVRKHATSWADMARVDPQKICDAAIWKTECTFAKHYRLDLLHKNRSELGRRVLKLAASSSAEAALNRHQGRAVTPTSTSNGLPDNYRIPRKR